MEQALPQYGTPLQRRRQALGIRQDDLAGALGVSVQTLCNYEQGRTAPDVTRGRLIAKLLETTVEELWPEDEDDDNES